jgi:hypothetical protein
VMISGIMIFALWTGIIVNGYAEELRRREFLRTWELVAKVPFFHNIGASTIADVARLLRSRQYPAGTINARALRAGRRWARQSRFRRRARREARLSIEERCPGKPKYLAQMGAQARRLVDEGRLLEEDVDLLTDQAARRYDETRSAFRAACEGRPTPRTQRDYIATSWSRA